MDKSNSSDHLDRALRCWGKTVEGTAEYHPALFHMLDVAHVARELLGPDASPRWKKLLAASLGCPEDTLQEWLPWFISGHDIGKISAPFQGSRRAGQRPRLLRDRFSFGSWPPALELPHALVGQAFIDSAQLADCPLLPATLRQAWGEMTGGHHGRFAAHQEVREAQRALRCYEPPEWAALRQAAVRFLNERLLVSSPPAWPTPPNISSAIMALTGFTILCDWLGSNSLYFPPWSRFDVDEYDAESRRRARQAVQECGFLSPCSSAAPVAFSALFPDKQPPRPLQEAIDVIPSELLAQPCLAIIEAPTGEGKTEAALALAHRLAAASGSDELYYALPTMATSNQMFMRVQEHLRDRLALPPRVKLIHGQAFLIEDDLRMEPLDNGEEGGQDPQEWFGPKKRALLAPFGVGTIDQAELAALNVKHAALRMVGLAGKVVIFDEVHAYDTYMTAIVERLLHWLAALGASVIILSATLPQTRRAALAQAYGVAEEYYSPEQESYPCLWVGSRQGSHRQSPSARQTNRQVELRYLHLGEEEAEAKARWLLEAVAEGGCACWMANTVRRAQQIFEAVDCLAPSDVDRALLHAQFPLERRQRREEELYDKYGPKGARPQKGIVVGTQVLEQSLDLDFDVLASDLAPIDLLLQRAGRMYRHERLRPPAHGQPRLWVNAPLDDDGAPIVNTDRYVYAEYFLRQTWRVLAGRQQLALPADYRLLVEAVYGAAPPPGDPLYASWEKLQREEEEARAEARLRLLPEPAADRFPLSKLPLQFEEDEDGAAWIVGRTRLGEETVTVIPLERTGAKARLWPDGPELALDAAPPRETQLRLRRQSLRLSHRDAVQALKSSQEPLPPLFSESALLRGCRPLWLVQGEARLPARRGTLRLSLHPKLGLLIEHQKGG